ncbi:MAG: hypothetical protein PVF15_05760 [Candidatus Bathyarchaeota archaeon]
MKCKLCKREAKNRYCEWHEKAYTDIQQKFEMWKSAAGLSWEQYLNELVKNPFTGIWAKEVAEQLLKNKE